MDWVANKRQIFFLLCFLPLVFLPIVNTSSWISSSDVHSILELASSLVAVTAGVMVLLHFLTTGRLFFLLLSIGFVQIGAEEFVHALFSSERIWTTNTWAISSTWLLGRSILVLSFFIAYFFGDTRIEPHARGRAAIILNLIGFVVSGVIVLSIFHSKSLPSFVTLGSPTKMMVELVIGGLFFVIFGLYYDMYSHQESKSPLLLSIIGCIIFQVLIHVFVFNSRLKFDAHWDAAHLIKLLAYFFPIFGVWGETIKLHQRSQIQLIDLEREVAERKRSEAELATYRGHLEELVVERTSELQTTLENLHRTKDDLIQAERLASLGSMVAGISHELNTPIGNALVVASTLEESFRCIGGKMQEGALTRSALADFVDTGKTMCDLALRSIARSAELVASFKRVSTDQTSEKRRVFNLRSVVEDNVAAVQPNLKKYAVTFEVAVPEDIECDSFPGPLGQVITNIVQNAVIHGLEHKRNGTVRIFCEEQGGQVLLRIVDDGVGMAAAVLAHVFNPFFTTKLGRGGSGLGLSISHRLTTSVLGGELSATSAIGQGTTFTISFPKNAPFRF